MILLRGTLHRTLPRVAKTVTIQLSEGWTGRGGRFVAVDARDISRQWKIRRFVQFRTVHATPYFYAFMLRIEAILCLGTTCHVTLS